MESNIKPTEKEEANNKEMTTSKQTSEKLKEKDDQEKPEEGEKQPQISRKGKQRMEEPSQGHKQVEKTFTPPLPYPQSALIQQGLPPKLEDPGSFFLPCTIGNLSINKAMCDLGASINLVPSSLMKRLCINEVKPIQMSLELVDKSVVFSKGVVENLLVKVDKFIFPADFVILDLDEEGSDSIILGRPFLATARAIIDVEQGELTLRMHDESITLNVFPET
ncbi:uncharacterized protein LOC107615701 [Arachis ipaensis]|uniref:uncharacterized protein LOC107615701 n=1 Tax=Arachis ipaensis TaxID=130454 RepID=UPI0007AF5BC5|nr:uncharacterized protein LOC107615701 [Arachis ipaensis]